MRVPPARARQAGAGAPDTGPGLTRETFDPTMQSWDVAMYQQPQKVPLRSSHIRPSFRRKVWSFRRTRRTGLVYTHHVGAVGLVATHRSCSTVVTRAYALEMHCIDDRCR